MLERLRGEGISQADRTGGEAPVDRAGKEMLDGGAIRVVDDASSLIADAAEELTFEASETVEKKAEERRVEKEKPSPLIVRIKECCKLLPDFDKDKFQLWLKGIFKNPPRSREDLLESLKEFSGEVSHQYLALSVLEEFSTGDPALRELAEEAKKELDDKEGPSIRAAFNTGQIVETYAERGLDSTENLRDFYRKTVLHYEGATETFKAVLDRFPGESLPEAIQYLIRAVGNDLHSRGSSIDKEELRTILNDLYYLETLGHLHGAFETLMKKVQEGFHAVSALGPRELLGQFLALKDNKWLSESNVLSLLQEMGLQDSSTRIYFLQGFINIARSAPLKLFSGDDERNLLISKIQDALDRCIEEEV
ncbi:MAG: type III secretion system gatekeeper subunit SctW [Thermodesulforhabdaceae bacterium]